MSLLISELVVQLQEIHKVKGDLPVYYADDYDNVLPVTYAVATADNGWEGEPDKDYVALS